MGPETEMRSHGVNRLGTKKKESGSEQEDLDHPQE